MKTFANENPTTLYKDLLQAVYNDGDVLSPRGKRVKEIRPCSIEFLDPTKRVTFLPSRKINPFFQLAESFQIAVGVNDAVWLSKFNSNMLEFSDDGKYFNAFYGERIRHWGDNVLHNVENNKSMDQLYDVYRRFIEDKDTRQATIAIGNPSFDNYNYLYGEQGKDIACNLYITFKIRDNKLHMCVFNRSNDLHYGVMGANIVQFSTIQETLYSWLKNSGKEQFENLQLGTYHQITDSLHIYLDDYGCKITSECLSAIDKEGYVEPNWVFDDEPRMDSSFKQFTKTANRYYNTWDKRIIKDETDTATLYKIFDEIAQADIDPYLQFIFKSMVVYRLYKRKEYSLVLSMIHMLENCSWKVSMLNFIKDKMTTPELQKEYGIIVSDMVESVHSHQEKQTLYAYLTLSENKIYTQAPQEEHTTSVTVKLDKETERLFPEFRKELSDYLLQTFKNDNVDSVFLSVSEHQTPVPCFSVQIKIKKGLFTLCSAETAYFIDDAVNDVVSFAIGKLREHSDED